MKYAFAWVSIASLVIPFCYSFHVDDPHPELRPVQSQQHTRKTFFGTYATNVVFTHVVLPVNINLVTHSFKWPKQTFELVLVKMTNSSFSGYIQRMVLLENAILNSSKRPSIQLCKCYILANAVHSHYNIFQVSSQNDLTKCLVISDIHFCLRRQVLKTNFKSTSLAGIFKTDNKKIFNYCKFKLNPNNEQVFQITKDTYGSPAEIVTNVICNHNHHQIPLHVKTSQQFTLQPGCHIFCC